MTSDMVPDDKDVEIAQLRRGINDLVALLALSATWSAQDPSDIGRTLGEALFTMLRLDFVSVELVGAAGERVEGYSRLELDLQSAEAIGAGSTFRRFPGKEWATWPAFSRHPAFGTEVSISTIPLGLGQAFGTIVVGTRREDFPTEPERLLLSVARNQALLALQEGRVQREQQDLASELSAISLVEGIPGFVAVLAADGRVERVNQQIIDYCGCPLEELQHWGTNGIVHPDDMPHVAEIFGASIASGTPYVIEQRLRRADGVYRWFDNRGRPLRDDDGAVVSWHVLLTDIEDGKRAEEAVRASERNLRQQSETFPQMLWSATADGNIDYCNERLLEYSGLTAETVMDGGWVNLLHPDDRERTAKIWMRCVGTGDPYSVEVRHFHVADQSWRWILTMALPLHDAEGRIVKWYGSCVDIHDLKLTQERLRASERHLVQLIDTMPAYVFSAAPDGAVNYLNPQMREWFGRAEETILAEEWVHLVHPEDRDLTVEAWMATVAAGTPYRHEVRFIHRDGEYRWTESRAQPLRDGEGTIVAWHGVVEDIHDRKIAEEALRSSEQNLRLTIDTIPALVWSARTDGTADFFNQHYLDFVGMTHEELCDWQWVDLVHPDDLGGLAGVWETCRRSGTEGEAEARLRRQDGEYRWFLFQANPLRDGSGRVIKWYGLNTDIEERKQSAIMLAEAHDHLTQAQRLSQTGSFRTDVANDTHIQSDELQRILECAPPTLQEFRDRIHPEDVAAFSAGFKRSMLDNVNFDETFRFITPNGTTKHLHAVAHFIPDRPEHPVVMGSIQDVTELHAREEDLRRSAHYLAAGERVSLTGSFAWDIATDAISYSEQLRQIHELAADTELTGADFRSRIHPEDLAIVDREVARLTDGLDNIEYELRLLMPDGRIKYVRAFAQMIQEPDGRTVCVGAVQDVTQRRTAEDAVERVRSDLAHVTRVMSLGQLTASIAHEVSQPLSGIITNSNACLRMLGSTPPDVEGAIKTAQRTLRDGNRATEVITRLRALFRKKDFVVETVDLSEVAAEVVSLSVQDLQRRGIPIQTKFDQHLAPVAGDRVQLQQVILNLILNAADAIDTVADRPGQIVLESRPAAPGFVQLTVRDTGPGISADDPNRIFEAFYTTKADGMGIGLSVSRSIIERHAGEIEASANDGPGMTFAITLPVAASLDGSDDNVRRADGAAPA